MADLSTSIGSLKLKNPVLTASGTFGYGEEFADFIDLNRLGGFIVKGTTLELVRAILIRAWPRRLREC